MVLLLWGVAGAGWALAGIGLWRGFGAGERGGPMLAHVLTALAGASLPMVAGMGSLYTVMGLAGMWWGLVAVRPRRLLRDGDWPALAAFLLVSGVSTYVLRMVVY